MMLYRILASIVAFLVIFFIWCTNYIALELEQPFGDTANGLPMVQLHKDWNKSLATLLHPRGHQPPPFQYEKRHKRLEITMSDGSTDFKRKRLTIPGIQGIGEKHGLKADFSAMGSGSSGKEGKGFFRQGSKEIDFSSTEPVQLHRMTQSVPLSAPIGVSVEAAAASTDSRIAREDSISDEGEIGDDPEASAVPATPIASLKHPESLQHDPLTRTTAPSPCQSSVERAVQLGDRLVAEQDNLAQQVDQLLMPVKDHQEELVPLLFTPLEQEDFEEELRTVGVRMKELHARIIDEEISLLSALGTVNLFPDSTEQEVR